MRIFLFGIYIAIFAWKILNMKLKLYPLFLISIILVFNSCKKDKIQENIKNPTSQNIPEKSDPKKDSIEKAQKIAEEKVKPNLPFSSMIFNKQNRDSLMAVFNRKYSEKERYTILALNRLDAKNKWRADTLMIPAKIDNSLMDYSPFPYHLDILNEVNKFVVFSYPIQAYGVYSNGNLVKWGPTSMGKKSAQTKRGLMFANWKKKLATSTVDSEWKLPYNFNIHNSLGIGWHQYDLPGYPASHSCLRLLMEDAQWLYTYADQWILNDAGDAVDAKGTPVIVFGDYGWGKKKPWKQLYINAKGTDVSEKEMNDIIKPFLDEILAEQKNREKILIEIQQKKENETQQENLDAIVAAE